MGVEIERRFLVRAEALPNPWPRGEHFTQGYLGFTPVVRVRLVRPPEDGAPCAYLTLKGPGGRQRAEFEYSIPVADAKELLELCGSCVVLKERTVLGRWEVDRYLGRHEGLWLAECELERADEPLPEPLPAWLGREITEDRRYTNAALARMTVKPDWLGK